MLHATSKRSDITLPTAVPLSDKLTLTTSKCVIEMKLKVLHKSMHKWIAPMNNNLS